MAFTLPPDYAAALADTLTRHYQAELRNEHFQVEGRVEPTFVELAVVLEKPDRTFRYRMEFRAALRENRLDEEGALQLLIDFVGYYLDQYFEGGRDLLLPLDFQPYEMGEHVVYGRGDISNPGLEEEADRILEAGIPLEPPVKS
jgi:hypothetical protein